MNYVNKVHISVIHYHNMKNYHVVDKYPLTTFELFQIGNFSSSWNSMFMHKMCGKKDQGLRNTYWIQVYQLLSQYGSFLLYNPKMQLNGRALIYRPWGKTCIFPYGAWSAFWGGKPSIRGEEPKISDGTKK